MNEDENAELNNDLEDLDSNLPQETEDNESMSENIQEKVNEKISQINKKTTIKESMFKSLLPLFAWILVFLIVLIIIVGIILFFIAMPGMVMENLKNLSKKIGNGIASNFGAKVKDRVDTQQTYDVLDYLEGMGYDLKGYGFLTEYVGSNADGIERYDEKEAEEKKTKEGNIKEAKSDFINAYLASDNYVYTIANYKRTEDETNNGNRILGAISYVFEKFGNLFTTGQLGEHWGRGMISVYHDSSFGNPGTYYGKEGDPISWEDIRIGINEKKGKRNLVIISDPDGSKRTFNLIGWTGRYGMPIEFLLAIHVATMMPDLAYDMVESFDTQIVMLLHNKGNESYDPYISYVKNHWFRDIYFVQTNKELIDYDYNYESTVKERWTLYETYGEDEVGNDKSKVGEYKLYEINDDGTYKEENGKPKLFDGTADEAEKQGIKVAKKAVTLDYDEDSSKFKEINWRKENGVWSAYKVSNGSVSQTGEGLRTETNPEIKEIFLNNKYFRYDGSIETAKVITNLRKKITEKYNSENNKNIENYYGPVEGIGPDGQKVDYTDIFVEKDETEKNEETSEETKEKDKEENKENEIEEIEINSKIIEEINSDGTNTEETDDSKNKNVTTVSDMSGTVSLNQDTLNAFSMLENEHTLDADYVYRDFKELIVELGYFEKEELTDETPRLLEFLVPDTGSYLYPRRSLDKVEEEFGTLVHSKGDINAGIYESLLEVYQGYEEEKQSGELNDDVGNEENPEADVVEDTTEEDKQAEQEAEDELKNIPEEEWEELDDVDPSEWEDDDEEIIIEDDEDEDEDEDVEEDTGDDGATSNSGGQTIAKTSIKGYDFQRIVESGDGFDFRIKSGNIQYTHYYQIKGSYSEKTFTSNGTEQVIHDSGSAPISCISILTGYGKNVNPTDNVVDKEIKPTLGGITSFMKKNGVSGKSYSNLSNSEYEKKIKSAFKAGRPIIALMKSSKTGDTYWTEGSHFVAIVGMDLKGNIITLDPGSLDPEKHTYPNGIKGLMSSLSGLWIANKAPKELNVGEHYKGYLGNELVASPVTGILLEYGTYTEENVDSLSNEKYRTNVDLKYNDKITQVDEVGYAKILVLDDESYKKIEGKLLPETRWKNSGSFLNEDGTYKDLENLTLKDLQGDKKKDKDKWTDLEKSLYGYKEFAEDYKEAGISGYVLYIDGFKCEFVDEDFDNVKEKNKKTKAIFPNDDPSKADEYTITLDKYKETNLEDSFNKDKNIIDKKKLLDSRYEADDDYKLTSEKATKKLEAENFCKENAVPSFYFEEYGGLILIKEGTIIGRTITDRELIQKYRKQNYEDFRKPIENMKTGDIDKIIGNYLRIIIRDLDGTIEENAEDYMKLDDNIEDEGLGEIEKFMYWQAVDPEGFPYNIPEYGWLGNTLYEAGHLKRRDNPSDKYGHDYVAGDTSPDGHDLSVSPGIWLANHGYGSSGGAIFRKITGVKYISSWGTWCTGEQLLQIYYLELMSVKNHVKEALEKYHKDVEELESYQLFALMDTAYAGAAYLRDSSLPRIAASGGTPSIGEFMSATPKGQKRRMCDYYMYKDGKFPVGAHSKHPITHEYEFYSKTPFQDLMRDINGAQRVRFR